MKTSNGLSLLQRKLLSIIAESQCLLGKLGFNFFLDFYALHFIQWALGGTIKCLKSLPIKEKCIECLDSLIHFSSVAMHHFDWSLLHFWTPLQYWFFCLLQLHSCLVVNCTSMIYSPLHCLVVLNLSAVSALGRGVRAMINNNIHGWIVGVWGAERCRKHQSAPAVQCNTVGCNGLHSSLLQTPCHALSAQGSAPNTRFRNTRVCHSPQENGNVFLSMENHISAKATRG